MESINMVRCFLSKGIDEAGDVRYVPLEIFTLWRFLMERVHNLSVQKPTVSQWVPENEINTAKPQESKETVIEVSFKYMEQEGIKRPVTRYFPEDNFEQIFGYFRKHFSEENIMEGVQHRKGFYLTDNTAPYEA